MALPPTGRGVARVEVSGVARWFAYTYPACPLVWLGEPTPDGYSRFRFEVGTARNWYFRVPTGVRRFLVRAKVKHETDAIDLQVNAPDRTQARLYGSEGAAVVEVPEGLDGKIWHVRADIGDATRIVTTGNAGECRYLGVDLTLELKGVPGLLAPTWEQWFDPTDPKPAAER